MRHSVTVCKGGGGTVAELVAMDGQAVFDTTVSHALEWEKYAIRWMEERGRGEGIFELGNNSDQLISALERAFAQKEKREKSYYAPILKNHFHLDWLYSVLVDTISSTLSSEATTFSNTQLRNEEFSYMAE
mmetsp:Transcript_10665/g.19251  ORF Transcript_10665/g.19251 Transcript_10665/m.19251 type:complete len:131 (+) Transcript_10665:835-1227(+)